MKTAYKEHLKNFVIPCVCVSFLVGIVSGVFIFFYRLGAEYILKESVSIYSFVRLNPAYVPLLFLGLIALAFILNLILKFSPEAQGGGIPRAEGILHGALTFKWLRTLIGTVLGSFVSFFAGLPLGSEGPSVLIGASIGKGANTLTKGGDDVSRYVMTAGVAGSFAVATGAPVAGAVFAIEEANQRFSPRLILSAGVGVVSASAVAETLAFLFHIETRLLLIGTVSALPLKYIWVALLIGLFAGVVVAAFNTLTFGINAVLNEKFKKISRIVKLIIVFVLVGVAGIFYTDILGGGHALIMNIAAKTYVWWVLLIFLVLKLVLVSLCCSAGATGGLFVPMLAVGAIIGGLMAELFGALGVSDAYYNTIVILSVAAFLGAAIRAPITAVVFIVEATGSFTSTLYAIIAVIVALSVISVLKIDSINDLMLARLIKAQND